MALHRGKIARPPVITNVRALVRDDLALLRGPRAKPLSATGGVVKRLRDPHHRLARLVASGLRFTEVAERSGYSEVRISMFNQDPAFLELVAVYREKIDAAWVKEQDDYMATAMGNMRKAEVMIAEKLEAAEETGEFLPTRDLIAISRDAADRFGYGKRQTNVNVNADFATLLEKAILRSESAPLKLIEPKVISPTPAQSQQEPNGLATAPASVEPSGVLGRRRI